MPKITSLKTYLKSPSKCFIPKCKARCCINAPLPEDFLPKHKDKVQRHIFSAVNMGQNDPRDTYNSVIYSTRPITFIGFDETGKSLYGISKETMERYQLKSMEDIERLLMSFEEQKIYNYCPFITDYARCSVYKERPPICREFGTMPGVQNVCPDKASRNEILKFNIKSFLDIKGFFRDVKQILNAKFGKNR